MSVAGAPAPVLDRRRAGVLLHPTSLPGGSLGAPARAFVDFLAEAGFGLWQVLPLGPPHADRSPYQARSAQAGDPALVDLQELVELGWLAGEAPAGDAREALHAAREGFEREADDDARAARADFERRAAGWLHDHALYTALSAARAGEPWWQWPARLRDRDATALAEASAAHAEAIADECFGQWLFDRQWRGLRRYANERDVLLFGDVPIFVARDSADVWAWREQFLLDAAAEPTVVAGVPPDYFSATGQRWGNPLYDWERMRADGYRWWTQRLRTQLDLFDVLRVDHFRGFAAHWEIPAADDTAVNGRWVSGPGEDLFDALGAALGPLPLVAEDLGTITPDVAELLARLGLPGMKVLHFAFGGDAENPYLPHNHEPNAVAYTGTHDNDTTVAWVAALDETARAHACRYLRCAPERLWAVLPMQDLLALGEGHRMNVPGTQAGNWCWRFDWDQVPADCAARWLERNRLYGRMAPGD